MYDDYKNYLLNIRNSLIQSGVEFPEGISQDMSDYYNLYKLGIKLEDILLFYKVLSVSGSESMLEDFFLPLNETYKDRMRGICYNEFISNILPDYKSLIGDEEDESDFDFSEDDDIYFDEDDNENNVNSQEDESIDLFNSMFEDDNPEDNSQNDTHKVIPLDEKFDRVSNFNLSKDDVEYVVNGIDLDSEVGNSENENVEYVSKGMVLDEITSEETIYESKGVDLDDLDSEDSDEDEEFFWDEEEEELFEKDEIEESTYDSDDEELEESPYGEDDEEDEDDYFESPYNDEDDYTESSYDEDDEEIEESPYDEDDEEFEESPYDSDDDEIEESPYDDEDDEEFSWDEEESPYDDDNDEEEIEESPYDDDDDEIEESPYDDDDDEIEESPYGTDDDDEIEESPYGTDEDEEPFHRVKNEKNTSKPNRVSNPVSKKDRDLGDELQDITNSVLTKIKRGAINFLNRKE